LACVVLTGSGFAIGVSTTGSADEKRFRNQLNIVYSPY
jgi:phosphomevalonate kinase